MIGMPSEMFTAEYTRSTTANAMMNAHEPPNRATASATRSGKVASSSIKSFGFRIARLRASSCVACI